MNLEEIRNFLQLSDNIATAGQPTEAQLQAIREAGYQVIINLALPSSSNALPNEQELVTAQGMHYIHIPVEWDHPTVEDARRFFTSMDANAGNKVFVHCAANMRVSAFMYLYRTLRAGMPQEDAERDLHRIWTPDGHWQEFIENVQEQFQHHQS